MWTETSRELQKYILRILPLKPGLLLLPKLITTTNKKKTSQSDNIVKTKLESGEKQSRIHNKDKHHRIHPKVCSPDVYPN